MDAACQNMHDCPILSATKGVIFVLVAVFVLYLPLGDPKVQCSNKDLLVQNGPLCCLCDVHNCLIKAATTTVNAAETFVCLAAEMLYQAKLKMYSTIEKVDSEDLCRSVCSKNRMDSMNIPTRHTCMRCLKKKIRRNHHD